MDKETQKVLKGSKARLLHLSSERHLKQRLFRDLLGFLYRSVAISAMAQPPCRKCGKVSSSRTASKHHNKNHNKVPPITFAVKKNSHLADLHFGQLMNQ